MVFPILVRFLVLGSLVVFPALFSGCSNQNAPVTPISQTASAALTTPPPTSSVAVSTASITLAKDSPLEKAHKEYLEAYEVYVQALRENGPQTMETLNALADYQKKYQLYQMILKAQDK